MDDPLLEIADRLYAVPAAAFTTARDDAARTCGDKALAARVKKLRKPSVAAAAVNVLVRRESDRIDEVFGLAGALRDAAAAMDGDELRALTRQRRQLTHALASSARALAREGGITLTAATTDQVEQMLNAAMLDPVAADVLRTGLVVTAFASTGVGDLDPSEVLAVPEAVGARASAVAPPERQPLRAVPDNDAVRRARLEDAVDSAREAVEQAQAALKSAEDEVASVEAERLRIADEIDQTRRRLAQLEEEADRIDDDAAEAVEIRDDAATDLEDARAALQKAEAALDD